MEIHFYFSGEEYTDSKGTHHPARVQTLSTCKCQCIDKLTAAERTIILERFNKLADHDKQNIYLRGCITQRSEDDIRRRQKETVRNVRRSFIYSVVAYDTKIDVCQDTFLGLHGIQRSRLRKKFSTSMMTFVIRRANMAIKRNFLMNTETKSASTYSRSLQAKVIIRAPKTDFVSI